MNTAERMIDKRLQGKSWTKIAEECGLFGSTAVARARRKVSSYIKSEVERLKRNKKSTRFYREFPMGTLEEERRRKTFSFNPKMKICWIDERIFDPRLAQDLCNQHVLEWLRWRET